MTHVAMHQAQRSVFTRAGHKLFVSEHQSSGRMPILFLNSLAADLSMWNEVRDRLDHPSIAFDARGHGQSDTVQGDAHLRDLVDDAAAVLHDSGVDRVVLCGLSLGGLTAMQLAAEMPDHIAGLVLANTAVNFPPPQMWRDRANKARNGAYAELVAPTLERWLTKRFRDAQPDTADSVLQMLGAISPEGYAAACAVLESGDATDALKRFSGPVLAIAGLYDQSTPVTRLEEIVDLANDAELVVLDGAHITAIECPVAFSSALQDFIKRVEKDG